jgi:hypothetical protein
MLFALFALAVVPPDTLLPRPIPVSFTVADSTFQRPRAFQYSQMYYTRLAIHHWASYATIPLFLSEAYVGQKLYNETIRGDGLRTAHQVLAVGIAGLFGVNTITGAWNLWEARKDPNARTRRYIHAALMLASDAGFVATAATTPHHQRFLGTFDAAGARQHRAIAVASMSTALIGYVMMLVWK